MRIRIGYAHPDRLLSYPDLRYLSGCLLPIRMFVTYPDVLQPGLGGLRAGVRVRALALLAASGAAVSHVIPLRMFQVLKSDR